MVEVSDRCQHEVATAEIDGTTRWFCWKCLCQLKGSTAEFPDKSAAEIMTIFYKALPKQYPRE